MEKKKKKDSINYWDRHAKDWERMAYNKEKKYFRFPSSEQRENITVAEIEKISANKNLSIVDIGCANGELVRHLLKNGFKNVRGVDNSVEMIGVAKQMLKKEMPKINPDKVFSVEDADSLKQSGAVDMLTGMGIIEYLLDVDAFFSKLSKILKTGGYAFIESKNKLFNLFSANNYTSDSNIAELVQNSEDVRRLSPIQNETEIEKVVLKTFTSIGDILKKEKSAKDRKKVEFEKYPFHLPQYSPEELETLCKKHGLNLKYIIYYHPHPFPPKFEHNFPQTFNKIALMMEPLGYTPLGATLCSSFIAVIQK